MIICHRLSRFNLVRFSAKNFSLTISNNWRTRRVLFLLFRLLEKWDQKSLNGQKFQPNSTYLDILVINASRFWLTEISAVRKTASNKLRKTRKYTRGGEYGGSKGKSAKRFTNFAEPSRTCVKKYRSTCRTNCRENSDESGIEST